LFAVTALIASEDFLVRVDVSAALGFGDGYGAERAGWGPDDLRFEVALGILMLLKIDTCGAKFHVQNVTSKRFQNRLGGMSRHRAKKDVTLRSKQIRH